MATDGVILTRDRLIAAKIETTTGTAIALAAADGALNAFDLKIDATIPPTEREMQGSLTNLPQIPGPRQAKVGFRTEVYNAAANPLSWSPLLLSCGFAVATGVYTPTTGNLTTSTIGLYEGAGAASRLKEAAGCMGNVKISGEYGKPAYFMWDFMGKWVAPTGVTRIAPTFPAVIAPRCAAITLTIGGATYRAGKFEIDMGNKLSLRQDVTDVTGYRAAYIVDRHITIKIPAEAVTLATHDFYADHLAGTTAAISIVIGSGANNVVTIAAPAAQLLNPPQMEDREGILLDSLEFLCTSTTADSGEFTITLS